MTINASKKVENHQGRVLGIAQKLSNIVCKAKTRKQNLKASVCNVGGGFLRNKGNGKIIFQIAPRNKV